MRVSFPTLTLLLFVAVPLVSTCAEKEVPKEWIEVYQQKVRPLFHSHCLACHGDEEPQASLNLAKFPDDAKLADHLELLQRLGKRVQAGEMPPEGSEPLTPEQKEILLGWVSRGPAIDLCNQLASDETQKWYRGYVMSRRLTRSEYNNAVRDLIGIDLRLGDSLPADGAGGEGFDTNGDSLFTSAILMEKYLQAAERAVWAALPDATAGPTEKRGELLVVVPSSPEGEEPAARRMIEDFARRAYRRPVQTDEIDRLLTLYRQARERGDGFMAAVRDPLQAILLSPHFLFVVEAEPDVEGVYRLTPHQFATRLALFLWSSIPDGPMHRLAEDGSIFEPEVLRELVSRMLADPRSKALGESFATQWLGFGGLGESVKPDPVRFPEFDNNLAAAMKEETTQFFHHLFQHDRSLLELVQADYTFVNDRLAKHYGIEATVGSEFQKVHFSDPNRGGVLTMGSILTVTSYPLRTSPVLRGRWVLEEILGSRVPPPPPNVPPLAEGGEKHDSLTLRQRLEQHRKDPQCAACHNRMDPLGFGLENFDAVGRWRTHDAGQAVDSTGTLPSGESFNGPGELKKILLQHRWEFLNNLTRKMLGYALGRELNNFDKCVVDDTIKELEANNFHASVLVNRIVSSYPFQHRFSVSNEPGLPATSAGP